MKRLTRRIANLSIRTKFVLLFVLTSLILLFVNTYMFYSINHITNRLDEIYVGNVQLSMMSESLTCVQESMTEYLNTKTSDAIEDYYREEENFGSLVSGLYKETTDNKLKLMERNIRHMSESYLELTGKTIEAKRGRNVEKYKRYYDEATHLYSYLEAYLSALNTEKFRMNTESYEVLSSSLRYLEWISITIFIVLGVFNVLLVILVTGTITKPLLELSAVAGEVAKGNLEVDVVPVGYKDEVGVVTTAFNQMVVSIREYIKKLRTSMENEQNMKQKELKMEAHLKDAQLKYLQAQINPHFLFNTLNAGAQLAMMEEADRTYDYIQNVAAFFRYNIKKDNDVVTLADEIRLVDNYIYILNVRFSGEIHFTKDVDEKLLGVKVPSMILQPIVENSVNYGIRDIDRTGEIKLDVYREGENVCVCITDNGVGMEQVKVDEIMEGVVFQNGVNSDSNGVGLHNVMERLHLFFERDDCFTISSEGIQKGTKVCIAFPFEEM